MPGPAGPGVREEARVNRKQQEREVKRLLVTVASAAGLAGLTMNSLGAGFALYEGGARINTAPATVMAKGDDVSAQFFNPAGMTQLKGLNTMAGVTAIKPGNEVSTKNPYTGEWKTTQMDEQWFWPPHAYIAAPVADRVSVGGGVYSRFGLGTKYDENWPGRYNSYSASIKSLSLNPNVAVKVLDQLSVGAGVSAMWFDLDLKKKIDGMALAGSTTPNNPAGGALDIDQKLAGDSWGYGWNLGLQATPTKWMQLGASYQSSVKQKVDGDIKFSKPAGSPAEFGPLFNDTGAEGNVKLPDMLFLGVNFIPVQQVDFGLGAIYTRWSTYDALNVDFDQPIAPGIAGVNIPKNYDNVWRYIADMEYHLTSDWDLRLGYFYDQSPVSDAHVDYLLPDNDRNFFNVGMGWHKNRWAVDFSYTYLVIMDRNYDARVKDGVLESEVRDGNAFMIGGSIAAKF